ncbi:MAG: DUF423 domain-containing protein [Bacteroidetes bacterium]|nr:DUF423 domain-containing protein [Bacteroidota bacterium]
MQKTILIAASLAGMTAVVLGAFGAHGLRSLISPEHLFMWEKGVQYQFYHAITLFLCFLFLRKEDSKAIRNAFWCFMIGILFFSGSLYLLATREITQIPVVILGPVTPIGGLFFIAGWSLILWEAIRRKQ